MWVVRWYTCCQPHHPGQGSRVRNMRPAQQFYCQHMHFLRIARGMISTRVLLQMHWQPGDTPVKKTRFSLRQSSARVALAYVSSSSAVPEPLAATSAAVMTEPSASSTALAAASALGGPPVSR
jgi:hypothetical protein